MGNLFACMRPVEDGTVPPVEITIRATCCNSKKVKISLDDPSHVEEILRLARALSKKSKSKDSSESSSTSESVRDKDHIQEDSV